MTSEFRLLVITDTHCCSQLGCEFLRRAIDDAQLRGGFDGIALLGDTVAGPDLPDAEALYREILEQVDSAAPGVPLLAVPGNHDAEPQRRPEIFAPEPSVYELGGYRFCKFVDPYQEGDFCTRSREDLQKLLELAGRDDSPIITLQHNPIFPEIEAEYPYMHSNRSEVMASYREAGVLLSISGHYHPGQPLASWQGVQFLTVPVLREPLFQYALVSLRGRQVEVEIRKLSLADGPAIFDCHVHTELAYCAQNIPVRTSIERCRTLGLAGLCLTEHGPQLYCEKGDFWAGRHISEPSIWRSEEHNRMPEFRRLVGPLRDDFVRVGLEVELDCEGFLTLHDGDREFADLIVGTIHWLAVDITTMSDSQLAGEFMRTNEAILEAGVDVLAHPWRFFKRSNRPVPRECYLRLAEMLAATNTAAEINFHGNDPAPEFFAACIERGVKIALGSDTPQQREAGALGAQLAMLQSIAGRGDVGDLLFYPD